MEMWLIQRQQQMEDKHRWQMHEARL